MPQDLISIISYLNSSEVEQLEKELQLSKIIYIKNEHGSNIGKGRSLHFEIKVGPKHYSTAKKIAEEFKRHQVLNSQRCPQCKSSSRDLKPKITIFQKILFLGTTPVRCKKCQTIYPL